MTSASTKPNPHQLNRDSVTQFAIRSSDDVYAAKSLRPTCNGMVGRRRKPHRAHKVYRIAFDQPASFDHIAEEICHDQR